MTPLHCAVRMKNESVIGTLAKNLTVEDINAGSTPVRECHTTPSHQVIPPFLHCRDFAWSHVVSTRRLHYTSGRNSPALVPFLAKCASASAMTACVRVHHVNKSANFSWRRVLILH